MKRTALTWALLLSLLGLVHDGHAHFGVFPAWYSQAQAQRGRSLALQQCAACHGPKLEGRYGPPLAGPRFLARWDGRSAEELGRYIATRMPLGRAGSLESKQVLDLIAYILQANGYPAGPKDLDAKSLMQIQFLMPDSKK